MLIVYCYLLVIHLLEQFYLVHGALHAGGLLVVGFLHEVVHVDADSRTRARKAMISSSLFMSCR